MYSHYSLWTSDFFIIFYFLFARLCAIHDRDSCETCKYVMRRENFVWHLRGKFSRHSIHEFRTNHEIRRIRDGTRVYPALCAWKNPLYKCKTNWKDSDALCVREKIPFFWLLIFFIVSKHSRFHSSVFHELVTHCFYYITAKTVHLSIILRLWHGNWIFDTRGCLVFSDV